MSTGPPSAPEGWRQKCIDEFKLRPLPEAWSSNACLVALSQSSDAIWKKYYHYRVGAFDGEGDESAEDAEPEGGDDKLLAKCKAMLAQEVRAAGQSSEVGAQLWLSHTKVAIQETCWEDEDDLRSASYHGWVFSPFALPRAMELDHRYHQRARNTSIEFYCTWDFKLVAFDGSPGDAQQQALAKAYPDGLGGDSVRFMHDGKGELHEDEVEFGMEVLCANSYKDPPATGYGEDVEWTELEDIDCANVNPTTIRRLRSWLFGSAQRSMELLEDLVLLRLVFASCGSAGFSTACGSIGYRWPRYDRCAEVEAQLRSDGLAREADWVAAGGGLTWLEYQSRLAAMAVRPQDKYYEPYNPLEAKGQWGRNYLQVVEEQGGDDDDEEEGEEGGGGGEQDEMGAQDKEMEAKAPWLVWDRMEREERGGGGFGDADDFDGQLPPGMMEQMMQQMMQHNGRS
jgi:hypothetical protein